MHTIAARTRDTNAANDLSTKTEGLEATLTATVYDMPLQSGLAHRLNGVPVKACCTSLADALGDPRRLDDSHFECRQGRASLAI